jgi:outer membrane protein
MKTATIAAIALAATALSPTADAAQGDWFFRVGAHNVAPKSDNGRLAGGTLAADIGNDIKPTFVLGRMLTDHWALELLASLPFEHDVRLNGARAGSFKHLPPTLSLDYYFAPGAAVSPFLGAGVNYTYTFSESEAGPLAGTDLKIGNSFGLAVHAGLAFRMSERWDIVTDVRWIDIDADVSVNGANVGTVSVDPLVYGVYGSFRF